MSVTSAVILARCVSLCVGVGVGVGVDPISFCLPTVFLFNFFCLVFFIVRLPLSAILA